jgi:hypothetical protein
MEIKSMTTSLDDALVDVRRAYRLLADYQQRLVELLAFIRSELNAKPYHQCFRNAVPRGFSGLEQSETAGKRFLPLLDVSVLSLRNNGQEDYVHNHKSGDLLVDINVISDSGNSSNEGVKEDAGKSAEDSTSALAIYFFVCDIPAPAPFNWYYQVWSNFPYPNPGEEITCKKVPGYRAYGEIISLAKFADEQSIRTEIGTLRQQASKKLGINI